MRTCISDNQWRSVFVSHLRPDFDCRASRTRFRNESRKERTTGMPHTHNDDELIRAIQTQTRRQDARMLREMGSHAPCTCSSKPGISSEHSPTCPLFIWHSAARALDLLTED
jgi:hypothetical protein